MQDKKKSHLKVTHKRESKKIDHSMKTVEELQKQIEVIQGELDLVKDKKGETADKFRTERNEQLLFLTRLLTYAKHRAKTSKEQVLVPTNEKGLQALYIEMSSLLKEIEHDENFVDVYADLKLNVDYLRELIKNKKRKSFGRPGPRTKSKSKKRKKSNTSGAIVKNGETHYWFTWDGIKLFKPLHGFDSLHVIDKDLNVIADNQIDHIKLDEKVVKTNAENGDFLLILRRVNTKKYKAAALTVTANQILKAREQRLQLAYTGGEETVASLIKRDLKGQIDKRLKDPKKIIDRYKEQFLSAFSFSIILRDIDRILKPY